MKAIFIFIFAGLFCLMSSAQEFTQADSLRGSITKERAWWDLTYYHLDIEVDPSDSTIYGSNLVQYTVLSEGNVMQIDLQKPLNISRVSQDGKELKWSSNGSAHFISLKKEQKKGKTNSILIEYGGRPHVAIRAPWDGGISWKYDDNGKSFVSSSCQGIGASIWWPCKDHMYDEVDSALVSVTVPEGLMNVGNGQLRNLTQKNGKVTSEWFVSNPINNYGININIGDYVHYSKTYSGEKGPLDVDYYPLKYNLEKAQEQFSQVPKMLEAFEYWFGPYPFYEDGFKLVEVPYLGMEHQSSITYGNRYSNGYRGMDLSETGWGLKFDFIIIHESGHEWFANNITYKDIADMWIHESFTAYSECLFLEYYYGKDAGAEYVLGTRSRIANDSPIIGQYNVNGRGSGDMYYKGSNMLHNIRQIVNNDSLWRSTLRGLNETFYHQTVDTRQIEKYIESTTHKKLSKIFDQYLRDTRIPVLEYRVKDDGVSYRWTNVVNDFEMPIELIVDGESIQLTASTYWKFKVLNRRPKNVKVDPDYYVAAINLTGS